MHIFVMLPGVNAVSHMSTTGIMCLSHYVHTGFIVGLLTFFYGGISGISSENSGYCEQQSHEF